VPIPAPTSVPNPVPSPVPTSGPIAPPTVEPTFYGQRVFGACGPDTYGSDGYSGGLCGRCVANCGNTETIRQLFDLYGINTDGLNLGPSYATNIGAGEQCSQPNSNCCALREKNNGAGKFYIKSDSFFTDTRLNQETPAGTCSYGVKGDNTTWINCNDIGDCDVPDGIEGYP